MGVYRTSSEPTCPFTYLLEETHLFLKTPIEKDTLSNGKVMSNFIFIHIGYYYIISNNPPHEWKMTMTMNDKDLESTSEQEMHLKRCLLDLNLS